MSRRALTLLLTVAAALGAGAAGAVAWFSAGSNATIAVTAFAPVSLSGLFDLHSQGTNPAGLSGYARQFSSGNVAANPLAATGSNATLTAQLGRSQVWTATANPNTTAERLRTFTVHVGTLPTVVGGVSLRVEVADGTTTANSPVTAASQKLQARIGLVTSATTPAIVPTQTVNNVQSNQRYEVNLLPLTTSADTSALWNATVRVVLAPTVAGSASASQREVQVLWCNKPGATDNCA